VTELGLFVLKKRRRRWDLIDLHKYLRGECKEERASLFSVVPSDKTRRNRQKLKHGRFHLNMRKYFFTVRVIDQCYRLFREFVDLHP